MTSMRGLIAFAARLFRNGGARKSAVVEPRLRVLETPDRATESLPDRIIMENAASPMTACDEALDGAIASLRSEIERAGAKINRGALPPVPVPYADLRRVFEALIGDALRHPSAAPLAISVSCAETNAWWRISVGDNGRDIDPERYGCVFEPGQSPRAGSADAQPGDGLAESGQIIERHGGSLWVMSRHRGGAMYSFSIPKQARPNGGLGKGEAAGSMSSQLAALNAALSGPQNQPERRNAPAASGIES